MKSDVFEWFIDGENCQDAQASILLFDRQKKMRVSSILNVAFNTQKFWLSRTTQAESQGSEAQGIRAWPDNSCLWIFVNGEITLKMPSVSFHSRRNKSWEMKIHENIQWEGRRGWMQRRLTYVLLCRRYSIWKCKRTGSGLLPGNGPRGHVAAFRCQDLRGRLELPATRERKLHRLKAKH